ncbi:metabotropic glutamate receptor 3-like [Antedon mediterranea]|uniref:metabotropic glutamate receptor 3-like n=1 Tax=Antedon mediterranea TaxID=105859 RepID=UPI003AF4170A
MMFVFWFSVVVFVNCYVVIGFQTTTKPGGSHVEPERNVVLGGVFPIRTRAENNTCGRPSLNGLQEKYAMVYAVNKINEDRNLLPGIHINTEIYDSCDSISKATQQAMNFIINTTVMEKCQCPDERQSSGPLLGVVGGSSSSTSAQMASLFRIEKITQVSYWATSSELNDRFRYGYHFRTVPSDAGLNSAIIQLASEFNWNYLSVVYEDSSFGRKAVEELQKQTKSSDLCLAEIQKFPYDTKMATEEEFYRIASKLSQAAKAKVVIVFAQRKEMNMLFESVRKREPSLSRQLVWILSHHPADQEYPKDIEGAFLFSHWTQSSDNFERQFVSEFLKNYIDIRMLPTAGYIKYEQNYTDDAPELKSSLRMSQKVPFIIDSVYSFAHALQNLMKKDNLTELPDSLLLDRKSRDLFAESMKKISFEGMSGNLVEFNRGGTIRTSKYKIRQFRFNGTHRWVDAGIYTNNTLKLFDKNLKFKTSNIAFPNSVCSESCAANSELIPDDENSKCCWVCRECEVLQYLTPGQRCKTCPLLQRPNANRTGCYDIPIETMTLFNKWGAGVSIMSFIGMILVIATAAILIKYRDTPIVKASGKELSYLLLWGIFLAYLNGLIGSNRPTAGICTLIRLGIGSSYTLCFAALLIKTNRISRIFNRSRRGAMKTTHCISPASQVALCLMLFGLQLVIIIGWLILIPPETVYHQPTKLRLQLVCGVLTDSSFMIVLIYPAFLLLVCVFYAFKTRKCPSGFNETKFIGFTAYITCIIWLSFTPVYFITQSMPLRQTALNVALTLSATVAFIFLFAPKMVIILFKPEKNTKRSIMGSSNGARTRTFKDIVKSVQAQHMGDKASDIVTNCKKPSLAMVVLAAKKLEMQRAAEATTEGNKSNPTEGQVVAEVHREDDSGIDNTTNDQHTPMLTQTDDD